MCLQDGGGDGRQRRNRTRRSSADADKNEDGFVGSGASWLDSLGGQREENAVVLAAVFYSCGAARDDGVELDNGGEAEELGEKGNGAPIRYFGERKGGE